MFTDWSATDPHYFFFRGALYGAIAATMFFVYLWPRLKKKFK